MPAKKAKEKDEITVIAQLDVSWRVDGFREYLICLGFDQAWQQAKAAATDGFYPVHIKFIQFVRKED